MSIYWRSRSARTGLILGDRSAWGKGYGSEVVQLRALYAFRELGVERLEADSPGRRSFLDG
jgi:RimJ/RimL family protein N-acetyltransferase